jgi:hypothetical protein
MGIGIAMEVASGVMKARGESKGLAFKSSEAAVASRQGKIAAAETDTHLREELRSVIGNIGAIRASSGIAPDSPTTQAIVDNEGRVSERERRIRVGNIMSQSESDERSSRFFKGASRDAWLYGTIGAVGRGFSQAAQAGSR